MSGPRISTFEIILLIVGILAGIMGFILINQVFKAEGEASSWLMIIAIFNWLILLVLFVSLSLTVDISKKQLHEIKKLVDLLGQKKSKK